MRSYRDSIGGGTVRFGRALAVCALIALVASLCYVAAWEVAYNTFASDYMTKYQEHELDKARTAGASEEAISLKKAEMDKFAVMCRNPAINAAMMLVEPLPVGLVFAVVSAGVLSRRKKVPAAG